MWIQILKREEYGRTEENPYETSFLPFHVLTKEHRNVPVLILYASNALGSVSDDSL